MTEEEEFWRGVQKDIKKVEAEKPHTLEEVKAMVVRYLREQNLDPLYQELMAKLDILNEKEDRRRREENKR